MIGQIPNVWQPLWVPEQGKDEDIVLTRNLVEEVQAPVEDGVAVQWQLSAFPAFSAQEVFLPAASPLPKGVMVEFDIPTFNTGVLVVGSYTLLVVGGPFSGENNPGLHFEWFNPRTSEWVELTRVPFGLGQTYPASVLHSGWFWMSLNSAGPSVRPMDPGAGDVGGEHGPSAFFGASRSNDGALVLPQREGFLTTQANFINDAINRPLEDWDLRRVASHSMRIQVRGFENRDATYTPIRIDIYTIGA